MRECYHVCEGKYAGSQLCGDCCAEHMVDEWHCPAYCTYEAIHPSDCPDQGTGVCEIIDESSMCNFDHDPCRECVCQYDDDCCTLYDWMDDRECRAICNAGCHAACGIEFAHFDDCEWTYAEEWECPDDINYLQECGEVEDLQPNDLCVEYHQDYSDDNCYDNSESSYYEVHQFECDHTDETIDKSTRPQCYLEAVSGMECLS
eukprot:UN28812